jgi:AcrR family transcriptional regulator
MSKGDSTRSRIVETALRSASVDGLEGITLGRVAADVGMSKSGLFAHFESKEALQVDVIASAADKFTEVVVAPALKAPRGEPRLRSLFEHWLDWEQHESLPGGCVFMHAAAELDDRPGAARDMLVTQQQRWLDTLAKAVRMAVEIGHFRGDVDPELFAFQVYGTVLSYYHAARLFKDPAARSRAVAAFESLVVVARPAGQNPPSP